MTTSRIRLRKHPMRIDRLVTIGIHRLRRISSFARKPEKRNRANPGRLPILMYHSISADPEPGISSYYRTVTTPGRFLEHMRFLKLRGWRGVSLRDGLRIRAERKGEEGSEKLFALTFDDGFQDFLTSAIPALNRHGFGATMFLPTAFVSNSGSPICFKGRPCLTWREIQELDSNGIEFGSHTVNHPQLVTLQWPDIESELSGSKAAIEAHTQNPITAFSYPFAFPQTEKAFCARLRQTLIALGYNICVTTTIGASTEYDDPLQLRRLPVNNDDDTALLLAKIEGAYDWLSVPQHAFKAIKNISQGLKNRAL
jgi:peptidoglycan/xylan/chitin deacetylase (PgdA/CDA1 family)